MKEERNEAINCLLDKELLPICMEHFTVPTNERFEFIKKRIDMSDVFVLLLGEEYGSCDENGISWTEREYDYAVEKKKDAIAIICKPLLELLNKDPSTYSESQRKQVAFKKKVEYSRDVSDEYSITRILNTFLTDEILRKNPGWKREAMTDSELVKWKETHKAYDLGGRWYHYHLSQKDEKYLRIGVVDIIQDFTPQNYKKLILRGENYSARYDRANDLLKSVKAQTSNWEGTYEIKENDKIVGIFNVTRQFDGKFGETIVPEGTRRGLHDFTIMNEDEKLEELGGAFYDVAPSPKYGKIRLFRSEKERFEYLKENYEDTLSYNEK